MTQANNVKLENFLDNHFVLWIWSLRCTQYQDHFITLLHNVSWFCFEPSVWVNMSVAEFNNCKVSDYKATIWTWTLTRDAWGARSEETPASCSGLGAREQGQYVAKIVFQDQISDEDMTLKPSLWMYLHKSFTYVEDLSEDDCEYWCPEAVQLPALCKYLTSHKFRDTMTSVQSWSHCVLLVSKSQKWILILFCVQILL